MEIIKIILENFKSIKHFELNADGRDCSVFGANGCGKTTLYDAYTWLLFDKASTGERSFSPKPRNNEGKEIHNLTTSVTGVFAMDNMTTLELRKELVEDWSCKRGRTEKEFNGNKINYYLDGVPTTKREYDNYIAEICPAQVIQLLTCPTYFAEVMPWADRRKLLLDICGDVSDADVLNSNTELIDLSDMLHNGSRTYSVDEYKKIILAQKKNINEQLNQLPARIDEAKRAIKCADCDVVAERAKIETEQAKIKELDLALECEKTKDNKAFIVQQINDKKAEISQSETNYNLNQRNKIAPIEQQYTTVGKERIQCQSAIIDAKNDLLNLEKNLANTQSLRQDLANQYQQAKASEWNGNNICPCCSRELPVEMLEEIQRNFNISKANQLENLRNEIATKCSKDIIANLENEINNKKALVEELKSMISSLSEQEKDLRTQIFEEQSIKFTQTHLYATLSAELQELQNSMFANQDQHQAEVIESIKSQIQQCESNIQLSKSKMVDFEISQTQQARVVELEQQEQSLCQSYEQVEKAIYLCELFVQTKTSLLTDTINDKFHSLKFRLFDTQINGGIKEDCEVLIPSLDGTLVPFKGANNASRINAGLEIIDTFAKHYNIYLPVFVDNAESVINLNSITPQTIRLVVSDTALSVTA